MNDIRMWNIREMRICIEWAKTFEVYQKMNQFDQVIFQISTLEIIILAENLKNLYNYRLQFSAKSVKFWNILNLLFQFALVRNFAFAFNLLNRVFYSQDHGPDKIVFQNGAFIMRQPQQQVKKRTFPLNRFTIGFSGPTLRLPAYLHPPDGRDHASLPTTTVVYARIRYLQSRPVLQSR